MDKLNKQQREAIRYLDGPLLVLAGAGSGKTRVITEKIAYLIGECDYAAHQICAVTFTNKAAREMKSRIAELLRSKLSRGLRVSTFHTLGLSILRESPSRVGLRNGFSIFDTRDSQQVLQELIHNDNADGISSAQIIAAQISTWKNALIDPQQASAGATSDSETLAAKHYAAYCRQLLAYNAVDFDDLIGLPLQLFREHSQQLALWQRKIRYLLVDEYQDTNASQYHLVKQLIGDRGSLSVVGDDDQSIYAWRGAQPENLRNLIDDFPRLKVVKLEQNYRSNQRILRTANHLIANNPHVFEKRLWSALEKGDRLRVVQCANGDDEADQVVMALSNHRFHHRGRYGDYAILYRSNHQARPFEQRLRERGIRYQISGGNSFFDHTEVKDVLAYLRLIENPHDDAAFLRIVNIPRREIGPKTLEKLAQYAAGRGTSLIAACSEFGLQQSLSERACSRLRQFTEWLDYRREQIHHGNESQAIAETLTACGYDDWLRSQHHDPKAVQRRLNNVNELIEWLAKIDDGEGPLADRLAKLALIDRLERKDGEQTDDSVSLMTLHTAKGLEFPHVFLCGLEDGLLPHANSAADGGIEEERRLLYVGITRAQRSLTMTLAKRRKRHGDWHLCEPSRFLSELPEDELDWQGIGRPQRPREEREQHGKEQLKLLKDLLKPT